MIQGGGHHEIFMKSAVQKDFTIFVQFKEENSLDKIFSCWKFVSRKKLEWPS